jgi:SAM-dependent methyltransferase
MTDTLLDLVRRAPMPEPWAEGDKIPWNDPAFSERMLVEHLSQLHDGASRRAGLIDRHVTWIHRQLLNERPSRVLDLGCGPGLYTSRLAELGHSCVGIDFSPASIRYAREHASAAGLDCIYHDGDLREVAFGSNFDLVMMIYGELNVFQPSHARAILRRAREALVPGGQLLLEVHTERAVRAMGEAPRSWITAERGLFWPRPHLRLDESFWDEKNRVATHRYAIIDAETAAVARYAETQQAYTDDEYHSLLARCGFTVTGIQPSLTGDSAGDGSLFVIVATAPV